MDRLGAGLDKIAERRSVNLEGTLSLQLGRTGYLW